MSTDDDLEALARASRERDAERDAWEADAANAPDLLAPLDDLERQRLRNAVRKGRAPSRSRRTWVGLGGAVAAAAAILLALRIGAGPGGDGGYPEYGLEIRSQGWSPVRSATVADAWTYTDGMTVDVLLRPATAAPDGVWAAVYRIDGGAAERLAWSPQVSKDGALRLTATLGPELELPRGPSRLAFVVGPREAVERWTIGRTDGVQVFERTLTSREEASP